MVDRSPDALGASTGNREGAKDMRKRKQQTFAAIGDRRTLLKPPSGDRTGLRLLSFLLRWTG